jgi:hypothetical protein
MYDNENELTAAERAAFDSLPRERVPGDLLEERVVSDLRRRGMLVRPAHQRLRLANGWRIAAAIALFAGGVATGRFILAPGKSAQAIQPDSVPVAGSPRVDRNGDRTVNTVRNTTLPVAHKEMWL